MTTPAGRRRRTLDQAVTEIGAAIDTLTARADPAAMTGVELAHTAGMSRKQLYTYFERCPPLRRRWDEALARTRTQHDTSPDAELAVLRTRVRQLEGAVAHWQTLAVIARADAEHHAQIVERLRADAQRRPHEHQPALHLVASDEAST